MKSKEVVWTCICLFLMAVFIVLPVTGVSVPDEKISTTAVSSASAGSQPFISAMATPAQAVSGEPVTISGVATGGNLTAGVQIWIFAGNYVNVSTVPVSADGAFSKTFPTVGLPPALYYVIVQSPGKDGTLSIALETTGQYSGQVVDTTTGNLIFNFTGAGSVQDAAAAQALSDAFNLPNVDDVYTKCTFEIVSTKSVTETIPPVSTTAVPVATTTAAKSPLSVITLVAGAGIAATALSWRKRE